MACSVFPHFQCSTFKQNVHGQWQWAIFSLYPTTSLIAPLPGSRECSASTPLCPVSLLKRRGRGRDSGRSISSPSHLNSTCLGAQVRSGRLNIRVYISIDRILHRSQFCGQSSSSIVYNGEILSYMYLFDYLLALICMYNMLHINRMIKSTYSASIQRALYDDLVRPPPGPLRRRRVGRRRGARS